MRIRSRSRNEYGYNLTNNTTVQREWYRRKWMRNRELIYGWSAVAVWCAHLVLHVFLVLVKMISPTFLNPSSDTDNVKLVQSCGCVSTMRTLAWN